MIDYQHVLAKVAAALGEVIDLSRPTSGFGAKNSDV
jgi:hypothetical protein